MDSSDSVTNGNVDANVVSIYWGETILRHAYFNNTVNGLLHASSHPGIMLASTDLSNDKLTLGGAIRVNNVLRILTEAYRRAGTAPESKIHIVSQSHGPTLVAAALRLEAAFTSSNVKITNDIRLGQVLFMGATLDSRANQANHDLDKIHWADLSGATPATQTMLANLYSNHDDTLANTYGDNAAGYGGFDTDPPGTGANLISRLSQANAETLNPNDPVEIDHYGDETVLFGKRHAGWWDWLKNRASSLLLPGIRYGFSSFFSAYTTQGSVAIGPSGNLVLAYSSYEVSTSGLHNSAPAFLPTSNELPTFTSATAAPNPAYRGEFVIAEAVGVSSNGVVARFYLNQSGSTDTNASIYVGSDANPNGGFRFAIDTTSLALGTWTVLVRVDSATGQQSIAKKTSFSLVAPGSPPPVLPSSLSGATPQYTILPHRNGDVSYDPTLYWLAPGSLEVWTLVPSQAGSYNFQTTGSTDTLMGLYDANGQLLQFNEDSGVGANAEFPYTLSLRDVLSCCRLTK